MLFNNVSKQVLIVVQCLLPQFYLVENAVLLFHRTCGQMDIKKHRIWAAMHTGQSNKTGANVLKVLEEGLSLYDLVPVMSDIVWVCDGGSNLLKALAKFTVASKFEKHILFPDHFHDNSDDQDSNSDNEQNDNGFDDNDANDQHKTVPNIILQYREKN
ncbi:unnamed protein product [Rotaria magnacalcarata]|uniref:Uncharacterized protein n=1 Tax=Rotaria magnacalcarata TaxID=392030 RepID=A0A815B053_9BILA|nr:unnamed protein product [Rotaria magnacalcarata]CAF1294251.1 unnamed protein product [Rotaria magnacalcarata]